MARDRTHHRGDGDEFLGLSRFQIVVQRLRDQHRSDGIGCEGADPAGEVDAVLGFMARPADAGIVDQNVDRPSVQLRFQRFDRLRVRHVERQDLYSLGFCQGLQGFRLVGRAAAGDDVGAVLGILLGEFEPDAATGAGYEHGGHEFGPPKPPPPGVSMTMTSPGATSISSQPLSVVSVPSLRMTLLRPLAPGPPPRRPNGSVSRRVERIAAVIAWRNLIRRVAPSPPRCLPFPPEPARMANASTRIG